MFFAFFERKELIKTGLSVLYKQDYMRLVGRGVQCNVPGVASAAPQGRCVPGTVVMKSHPLGFPNHVKTGHFRRF